eukprot:gene5972-5257_t
MTPFEVDLLLKPLTVKEFRIQLRARELSPAGGSEQMQERLKDRMLSSGDFALKNPDGSDMCIVTITAGLSTADTVEGHLKNNYTRGAGQNVGNFMTDRNSSRVLAPPGGATQISFGDYQDPNIAKISFGDYQDPNIAKAKSSAVSNIADIGHSIAGNNYSRPSGMQNVGNFMTDRNSSRVLAPPGGSSQSQLRTLMKEARAEPQLRRHF